MGIISNIKNKYKVNKNILWAINAILTAITTLYSGYIIYTCFPIVKGSIALITVATLCIILNFLSFCLNRKYLNTPISICSLIIMAMLTAILVINPKYDWYMWVEVALNVVTALLTIIYQFVGVKIGWKENKLVKIAKVKLDFDFKPEDLIEEYKVALNAIDKKYHFGAKDREKFEKEKEELLQDTHQILKEFISNDEVTLLDKLETLYKAKAILIISEDNYLLWKNQLINNSTEIERVKKETENLYKVGSISEEEYNHCMKLLEDEF